MIYLYDKDLRPEKVKTLWNIHERRFLRKLLQFIAINYFHKKALSCMFGSIQITRLEEKNYVSAKIRFGLVKTGFGLLTGEKFRTQSKLDDEAFFAKIVKKFHRRCSTGFWIHLWNLIFKSDLRSTYLEVICCVMETFGL